MEVTDDAARDAYLDMAKIALRMQESVSLKSLQETFQQELELAKQWRDEIHANERKWIDAGLDVDAEFAKTYYEDPKLPPSSDTGSFFSPKKIDKLGLVIIGIVLCAVALLGYRKIRRSYL